MREQRETFIYFVLENKLKFACRFPGLFLPILRELKTYEQNSCFDEARHIDYLEFSLLKD